MQALFANFRNAVTDFRADNRGNVALLFGLTVVMIFGAVGAGSTCRAPTRPGKSLPKWLCSDANLRRGQPLTRR